jgi:hypothetical protein
MEHTQMHLALKKGTKWESCTPILPKCQAHPHNTKKAKKIQKLQKKEKGL